MNLQKGDELIARVSAQKICRANLSRQHLRHLSQHLIASLMAERVVDAFESIQVHHQD
jgi:hypothetical protein